MNFGRIAMQTKSPLVFRVVYWCTYLLYPLPLIPRIVSRSLTIVADCISAISCQAQDARHMMLCMPAPFFPHTLPRLHDTFDPKKLVRSAVHRPLCIVSQWADTCMGIAAHRQTALGFLTPPYTHTAQGPYNPAGRPPSSQNPLAGAGL